MKYFGVDTVGETLPLLDKYLDREYKNVIVLLLDGMGINIIEGNLEEDGFFLSIVPHFALKILESTLISLLIFFIMLFNNIRKIFKKSNRI